MNRTLKPITMGDGHKQVMVCQPDKLHGTSDIEIWDKALKDGMFGVIEDASISVPTEGLLAVLRFNSPESMEQVGELLMQAAEKWRG